MERMWRKVNQGLSSRSKSSNVTTATVDTASLAGFGDPQNVVAVANSTGHRLATSGHHHQPSSFSQHVITTASSERRRRRRRKSRPRRSGERSGSRNSAAASKDTAISVADSSLKMPMAQLTLGNPFTETPAKTVKAHSSTSNCISSAIVAATATTTPDPTLRQRAVAKLRLFNFHLNWDLHMTQCKPCGPRSSGNILTRRLCRNRRREDNELYRSNSFKFERFERKDASNEFAGLDALQKQISVCDDYSLPIDFVKKRPSSFDPCLAETIIPDNWTSAAVAVPAPSPLSEHVKLQDPSQSQQQQQLTTVNQQRPIKIVEGYCDPKDSKKHKRSNHHRKNRTKDKKSNYSSDSSAPKSSADEDNQGNSSSKVAELNSPDSISEDLVRPLQPHKSPKRLTGPDTAKRNPSPYYYSDLLKAKASKDDTKDLKLRSRQSTLSEPPQPTTKNSTSRNAAVCKKSSSLDVPELVREVQQPKRYSITEEGVRIIRCDSPSTTTSDDSDCSECQKRREWHAKALALVRETCNISTGAPAAGDLGFHPLSLDQGIGERNSSTQNQHSMPPHRLLGPAVCACAAPAIGDDIDEFFRPRSIFYVHHPGVQGCEDCNTGVDSGGAAGGVPINGQTATLASDKSSSNVILLDEDMSGSRIRQLYETAFDCKVTRSDDDLDDVDRLTSQTVMLQINNGNGNRGISAKPKSDRSKASKSRIDKRHKNSKNQAIQDNAGVVMVGGAGAAGSASTLSNDIENIHIDNTSLDSMNNANATSTSQLPIRGYTPSPPSTAPLPVKFPGKHDTRFFMNSIKSAPNLPSSNPAHPRLRDLRLPVQTIRQQHNVPTAGSSETSMLDSSYNHPPPTGGGGINRRGTATGVHDPRPRSIVLESGRVLELRRSHHHGRNGGSGGGGNGGRNYSSTESMATSSSGGSMESLRSSTSEGNRSTSSSESRHSTSLSSHSSDSGHSLAFPLRAPVVIHSKLHILSPISDKSSQEQASESSEIVNNQRNNNSQKVSPEDVVGTQGKIILTGPNQDEQTTGIGDAIIGIKQLKKRTLPNKTLLHLTDEILGSDSGISLHFREDAKSQGGFQKFALPTLNFPTTDKIEGNTAGTVIPQDLRDLPFDMPKLRRRKTVLQQDVCTSGSATSVDLGDLPFDMPKLRRRLRMNPQPQTTNLIVHHSTESSGLSQASSSHSVRDENKAIGGLDAGVLFRQNLTLNLNEPKAPKKFSSLDLKGASTRGLNLNLGKGAFAAVVDLIDASIPLERQGWYHAAITRVDAECTLRPLTEGSFLVRNCESTKQDYSLSLKSAKGFMHMRIQRNDNGQFILGQFSRPFETIPEMIRHFCLNRLPVRGAEHMCLLDPVIAQLL